MKKYPVTYKGETYEVRWEDDQGFSIIILYKVNTKRKIFGRYKEVYIEIANFITSDLCKQYLNISDENYDPTLQFIYQAKTLLKLYEKQEEYTRKRLELQKNKEQALETWDGNVE